MKEFKIGLQLFSLRNELNEDFDATLEKVSQMGYEYVEFAGYYGKTADEVKAILEKHGLKTVSVHQSYDVFLGDKKQENIDFLKTLNIKYSVIPWMGVERHKGTDLYEETLKEIKSVIKLFKENGIQMLYHNHDFEFKKYEGKYLLEWLLEDLNGEMIPELDTCWVHYAGLNPVEYMKKYIGRLPVLHLKDFACTKLAQGPVYALIDDSGKAKETGSNDKEESGFEFRPVGYGRQDIPAILKAAEECKTEYIIVEQDDFTNIEPLEAVKKSREYLKALGL